MLASGKTSRIRLLLTEHSSLDLATFLHILLDVILELTILALHFEDSEPVLVYVQRTKLSIRDQTELDKYFNTDRGRGTPLYFFMDRQDDEEDIKAWRKVKIKMFGCFGCVDPGFRDTVMEYPIFRDLVLYHKEG